MKITFEKVPSPVEFPVSWEEMDRNPGVYKTVRARGCRFVSQAGDPVLYIGDGEIGIALVALWRDNRFCRVNERIIIEP